MPIIIEPHMDPVIQLSLEVRLCRKQKRAEEQPARDDQLVFSDHDPKSSARRMSNWCARNPLSITFPSGSTSTVKGMLLTPYSCAAAFCQKPRSLTCFHGRPSCLMAPTQASWLLSSETPRISKPLPLYLSYTFFTAGFSIRHGLHQLAQKSINTTL